MAAEMIEQIAALKKMSVSQLRERYAEVFGEASEEPEQGLALSSASPTVFRSWPRAASASARRSAPRNWPATRTCG